MEGVIEIFCVVLCGSNSVVVVDDEDWLCICMVDVFCMIDMMVIFCGGFESGECLCMM